MKRKVISMVAVLCLLVMLLAGCAGKESGTDEASAYPTKDITFIVNKAPGGGSDTMTRVVASALEPVLGVNCVVVNKEGGDGVVGMNEFVDAKADGYTLSVIGPNEIVNSIVNSKEAKFTAESFIPIATFNVRGYIIAVKPDSQFKSIEDVKEYAQENPGAVTIGIPGGALKQLALDFMDILGVELTIVNSGSGGDVFTGVCGGHLELGIIGSQFYQRLLDGNAGVLAQTVGERDLGIADVPTMVELGYELNYDTRMLLVAAKGTPDYVISKLNDAFTTLFEDEAFEQSIIDSGEFPYYVYQDEVEEYYKWFCDDQIPKLTASRDNNR